MQLAVRRALWGIQDDQGWHQLMWRAMMSDNSWDRSAQDYINLYNDTSSGLNPAVKFYNKNSVESRFQIAFRLLFVEADTVRLYSLTMTLLYL